jgi:hypothetical protein
MPQIGINRHLVAPLVALSLFALPFAIRAVADPFQIGLDTSKAFYLGVALAMAGALTVLTRQARTHGESMYIRRIAGVDAIDEAVGRSTEMGRPVLYVTGTEDISNIQTIASLLVLGHVARVTAEYDTEITVANCYPITMTVAEEIVRQGFTDAGRPDAHRPENVLFISSEQFAYAAGINSIILRDRPATNIYLGRFFAESLILAETGYVTKAIQIAGTAEVTQLPFFIAACDYTIIGEELYAVGAYLSREPRLLAMLKSTDLLKVGLMVLLLVGAGAATAHHITGGGADSRIAKWIFTESVLPFDPYAARVNVEQAERETAAAAAAPPAEPVTPPPAPGDETDSVIDPNSALDESPGGDNP